MATLEQINIQAEKEIERIEGLYKSKSGRDVTPMRRTHKNRDQLRLEQLRTIADWLEHLPDKQESEAGQTLYSSRLNDAVALVNRGSWTKAEMEAILIGGDDGNPNE